MQKVHAHLQINACRFYAQLNVENNMAFSEELKQYRNKHGLTQVKLAALLGLSARAYAQYEGGEFDNNQKKVQQYAAKLHEVSTRKSNLGHGGTPVYDIKATATQSEFISQLPEVPAFNVSIPGYEDCNFGMYVYGHSMYPTIENGSLILCRKVSDKSIILYGEIYLIRTADYLMVKRLQKNDTPGNVLCVSDNFEQRTEKSKKYEPFDIPRDKIIDLYLVKGIIKKTQS